MNEPLKQGQLALPILQCLESSGGKRRTDQIYDDVAGRIGLDAEVRQARIPHPSRPGTINSFEREVRWASQGLKRAGLAEPIGDGQWELTGRGKEKLRAARPGVVVTIYVTESGAALFGNIEDSIQYVDDGSCQLLLTSPPYPLLREKSYGNRPVAAWLDWMLRQAERWPQKLTADGSIVLNLADVWEPGRPTQSLYQERLLIELADKVGLRLCQRFAWLNPAKMPAPAEWVCVRRVRVKPSLEQVYWLSPHDAPFADNRAVLQPYSDSMRSMLRAGGQAAAKRPSGHEMAEGSFATDHGGSIPPNLITAANTESGGAYMRACKANGLPIHPARFPAAMAEFFVKMLTRRDDLVFDPFAGSNTTGAVAESLGRRWISCDRILEYVLGSQHRFGVPA